MPRTRKVRPFSVLRRLILGKRPTRRRLIQNLLLTNQRKNNHPSITNGENNRERSLPPLPPPPTPSPQPPPLPPREVKLQSKPQSTAATTTSATTTTSSSFVPPLNDLSVIQDKKPVQQSDRLFAIDPNFAQQIIDQRNALRHVETKVGQKYESQADLLEKIKAPKPQKDVIDEYGDEWDREYEYETRKKPKEFYDAMKYRRERMIDSDSDENDEDEWGGAEFILLRRKKKKVPTRKHSFLVKGSKEAKRYMAYIRSFRRI